MASDPHPAYPPPPWRLRGRAFAAGWLVRGQAPAAPVPPGWKALGIGPWRLLGAVWADYGVGGDLSYRELAVGLVVRRGAALAITLPWCWVDSDASLGGGRSLWAIPKQRADFAATGGVWSAETPLGAARLEPHAEGRSLGRRSFGFATAQRDGRRCVLAGAHLRADVRLVRADWRLPIPGLAARPLLSLRLDDLELTFGG